MDTITLSHDYKFSYEDLMTPVEIAEDYTLGNLCNMLAKFLIDGDQSLEKILQWPIHEFIVECLRMDKEPSTDLHYLRLSWCCSYGNFEDEKWTSITLDVDAVGDIWEDYQPGGSCYEEGKDYSDCNRYGISFLPLYNLRDLPIRINKEMSVYNELKYEESITLEAPIVRLIDLLYALFWEFSFYGSPDQRDDIFDGIKGQVEEIKKENNIED